MPDRAGEGGLTTRPTGRTLIRVRVPEADAALAADLLWQHGASAVEERPGGQSVVLVADVAPDAVEGRWPVAVIDPGDGWWDAWRPFAQAVRAGRHLVVRPPWVDAETRPDDLVVEIDPGRAFGSGSHGSTRLALAALEHLAPVRGTVLDVGCGSGVLSVTAALLGAGPVLGVDVDEEAMTATHDNAGRNGVAAAIRASTTPVADVDGTFDLVLANLDLPVLLDLAKPIADRVAGGGTLVASGMLTEPLADAVAALAPLELTDVFEQDGWAAAVLRADFGNDGTDG